MTTTKTVASLTSSDILDITHEFNTVIENYAEHEISHDEAVNQLRILHTRAKTIDIALPDIELALSTTADKYSKVYFTFQEILEQFNAGSLSHSNAVKRIDELGKVAKILKVPFIGGSTILDKVVKHRRTQSDTDWDDGYSSSDDESSEG